MLTAPQHIQWGTITLHFDDEMFRKAWTAGRSMSFDDCEGNLPYDAHHMNTLDATGSVLEEDGKGDYCFDHIAFNGPFDILGFFLGYMSGPIMAESTEEHKERMERVVIRPEEASLTSIPL